MSEDVSGGSGELMKFQKGPSELTPAGWHQPEQPPPACRERPRCGNCSHFYCGNTEKEENKKKILISWQHTWVCCESSVSVAWWHWVFTCGSAAQTEPSCACPSAAAPWSEDPPTAAKRTIQLATLASAANWQPLEEADDSNNSGAGTWMQTKRGGVMWLLERNKLLLTRVVQKLSFY